MTTPGSRRFFTAFYDAVSPLLKAAPPSPLHLQHHQMRNACRANRKSFATSSHSKRSKTCSHSSTSATSPASSIRFFGASFSIPTLRSRYVVSRGFASFCICSTGVPSSTAAPAQAASTVVAAAESKSARWERLRRLGFAVRYVHTTPTPPPPPSPPEPEPPQNQNTDGETGRGGIFDRVYHIHRPTKDQMLAAATNAWQRLRIRTKWSLIRQMRPYSMEDIGAFFSWLVVGHVIWILVGTTSFLTATIFVVNSVSAQETLAGFIGNYLTKETGVTVVFESAIVPRWKDNCIQFKNVFVSRRPGHAKQSRNVSKGSAETAAAAAAAASNIHNKASAATVEDDGNYTQFDVTIDTVNVTLSFARWVNGRGLLKDVEIKGVRGVIDRTHVVWEEGVDPKSYKNVHRPGDFEIEAFKIEDLLVTLYQPNGFRPFSVSIYSCDLPQLRKNWLFYDFLSANHCSGSYDDSLFTIHPRQSHNMVNSSSEKEAQKLWKKTSRLRIDGLEIDHLNRGIEGPFSWIQTGNVDIVSDVSFPVDDDLQFSKLVHDIYEHMEHTIHSNSSENSHHDFSSIISSIGKIAQQDGKEEKFIVMDLHVQLNDVRAAVPIFNKDLSYVNNAMIRPIVAYVNSRKTYIPINCRVVKKLCEFDGSWTIYDSALMDDLSAETYDAFARNVADEQARRRRIKKVGLWSLQLLAQAFLMAMAGSVA